MSEKEKVEADIKHDSKYGAILKRVNPSSQYGVLFGFLLLTFILDGSLGKGRWQALVILIVESITLLIALVATGSRRVLIIWVSLVIAVGFFSALFNVIDGSVTLDKAVSTVSLLLIVLAPISLVRAVIKRHTVDLQTVMAALCFYIMMGLFFGGLFSEIQSFTNHGFFAQSGHSSPSDFLYYSFATLTTVGYGDLTAAGPTGRTISVGEAVMGQLYLVTIVAVLVSNLGPVMRIQASKSSSDDKERSFEADEIDR